MRRLALPLGSLALAAAVFACEQDSSGDRAPNPTLDGGSPSLDGSTSTFDGSAPDASTAVTIRIDGRGGPKANVRVVFHDADGAVLETKLTGSDGKAASTGPIPAMASALLESADGQRHIVTWTGVESGDELLLRDLDRSAALGDLQVTLPGPFDGALGYDLVSGQCATFTSDPNGTVPLYPYCVRGAQASVLGRAKDGEGRAIAHSFKKANAVPSDAGVVDITTGAWAAPTSVTATVTNLPSGANADVDIVEIADGQVFSSRGAQIIDNAANSAVFDTAAGFADALQATTTLGSGGGSARLVARRAAPSAAISIDASKALPSITNGTVAIASPHRPRFSWTASTEEADGGVVRTLFEGSGASHRWSFVVPPGAVTVTAPAMPPEAASFLPTDDETIRAPDIVFIEAEALSSYAAFRREQGAFVDLTMSIAGFRLPAMPVDGVYRATTWTSAP
ncbi:MAG: hypothetical protein KF795_07080 [Labilithrix sp.]|nr:hypothetical protein [Labilithrix sp.]